MIAISLSPNTSFKDALLALSLVFRPWLWVKGSNIKRLEGKLSNFYGGRSVYTVSSARWALKLLLEALNLPAGSEVLIQGFTCVSVAGPVLWAGLKPVYVDILKNKYTMDPVDLRKKITPQSKVIVIQHTFGSPAEMDELMLVAKEHNLVVIEDCAHSIGAKYLEHLVGTLGDAAIISFGRDKAISGVFGGAALISSFEKFPDIAKKFQDLPFAKKPWVLQQLMHPILFEFVVKPLYFTFGIGKMALVIAQKIGLVSKAIVPIEKKGGKPGFEATKIPNALATLVYEQLKKISEFNKKRQFAASFYYQELKDYKQILPEVPINSTPCFLRYNILVDNPSQIRLAAKKQHILLGDWYEVIAPKDTDLGAINYSLGTCPVAEMVAKKTLNLPTNPNLKPGDLHKIIQVVKALIR